MDPDAIRAEAEDDDAPLSDAAREVIAVASDEDLHAAIMQNVDDGFWEMFDSARMDALRDVCRAAGVNAATDDLHE